MPELVPRAPAGSTHARALDRTRHRLAGDRPAVTAAIASLARAFDLRAAGEGRWELHSTDPAVRGDLVVLADDARSTVVELRLVPVPGEGPFEEAVGIITSLWPLLLVAVIFLDVGGYTTVASLFLVLFAAAVFAVPIAGVVALFEAQRLRRDRRWCADWQGRFMPALVARLDVQAPYR